MPKALRPATSHGQYRTSPIAIASNITRQPSQNTYYTQLANAMQASNMQSHSQSMSHHPQSYQTGGPVQLPHNMSQLQHQYHAPLPQNAPIAIRASSGAWTPSDDATLMAARSQGQNWAPIQATYFPTKTPNACRKRHERLMERRNSDDWDVIKLERMAKEYMTLRKEMWSMLAQRTGDKWTDIEAKCMASGLKNLQSASRACARRDRLSGAYTDDSGIGLDDLDLDAEAEYSASGADAATSYGTDSSASYGHHSSHQQPHHQHQHHQQQQFRTHGQQSLSPETEMNYGMTQRQNQQYIMQQQRISSIDMGIPSIINRGV